MTAEQNPEPPAAETTPPAAQTGPLEAAQLLPQLYADLRAQAARVMRREGQGHTLEPTALVHEVVLRLLRESRHDWRNRSQLLAVSASAMRRILVDHARRRARLKRGGGRHRVTLDPGQLLSPEKPLDVLAVDAALEKLTRLDPQQAMIVERRFFGGMTVPEVAESLQLSTRTVEREWTLIRAWLRRELEQDSAS